jgi:hypothetical protein
VVTHTLKKCSNVAVVTNKTILNVIMTEFGIFGVIMVSVAHCFENFYKITKNNILPSNFKKFQILKMEFSDILPFIIYVFLLINMITFATFVKFFVKKGYH